MLNAQTNVKKTENLYVCGDAGHMQWPKAGCYPCLVVGTS